MTYLNSVVQVISACFLSYALAESRCLLSSSPFVAEALMAAPVVLVDPNPDALAV